jgi:hypothetical protein
MAAPNCDGVEAVTCFGVLAGFGCTGTSGGLATIALGECSPCHIASPVSVNLPTRFRRVGWTASTGALMRGSPALSGGKSILPEVPALRTYQL